MAGRRRSTIGIASKAFCGCCGTEQPGRRCRRDIRRQAPAGGDCKTGLTRTCWRRPGACCWASWTNAVAWSGRNVSRMRHSFRPKKGGSNRQHEAGKRYEAGGGGGWRGRTFGAPRRVGLAPRVHAHRSDARRRERAAPRSSPVAAEGHAFDLRPGGRQRSVAKALGRTRGGIDLSASREPYQAETSRRTKTQTLSTALENRTNLRLAAELPTTCHPLRTQTPTIPGFRTHRLPAHHSQTLVKQLLGIIEYYSIGGHLRRMN